jgi:hypothetical protein
MILDFAFVNTASGEILRDFLFFLTNSGGGGGGGVK